jgi:transcriptional regulator
MTSCVATLGYPSRTEAIIALRRQGLNTGEIAARIGIETKTVSALEHSALRSAKRQKRPAEEHGLTILFPADILDRLAPHAARRGIHVNSLVRRIVDTAIDDNMIDAILDDADDGVAA